MSAIFPRLFAATLECASLTKQLYRQPHFTGTGSLFKQCKVLPTDNLRDAKLCEYLHTRAAHYLSLTNDVHCFGWGIHNLCDPDGVRIPRGLILCMNGDQAPLEGLERAYAKVIVATSQRWEEASEEDLSRILYKENPEKFRLYVKSKPYEGEEIFIRLLAEKLGLNDQIKCQTGRDDPHGPLYLYKQITRAPKVSFE